MLVEHPTSEVERVAANDMMRAGVEAAFEAVRFLDGGQIGQVRSAAANYALLMIAANLLLYLTRYDSLEAIAELSMFYVTSEISESPVKIGETDGS